MTGEEPTGYFSMRTMLPTAIAIWAVAFWFVYGPMVFAYLLLHAATTGVFLIAIRLSDRNRVARQAVPQAVSVGNEYARANQREAVKQAVAS